MIFKKYLIKKNWVGMFKNYGKNKIKNKVIAN